MNIFLRIFILLVIIWSLVAQLYFLAIPLFILYLLYHSGYELIFVAILIDGYYQSYYSIPILSISAFVLVFLFNIMKPRLLMYTGGNEIIS